MSAPPLVLSIVPPLIVNVPADVPNACVLFTSTSPALSVNPPVKVFVAERVSAPLPFLVREFAPLITPAIETLLPLVSIVPADERVTVRVDGEVIVPPACNVPPLKISVFVALPLPSAELELAFNVPAETVVEPVYVFVPVSVSVPPPLLVSPFAPLITPAIETGLPFVSIVPAEESVTVRVDGEVIVPPACNVPPEKTSVLFASPSADEELAFSVPAEIVVLPVYVFEPVSVSVPAPAFVKPKPEPEIAPPTVSVLADTVT